MRAEVAALFALSERADRGELPDGLVLSDEIASRPAGLARLAAAKAVLQARAKERTALAQAEYHAKVQERAEPAPQTGLTPRGRAMGPPRSGPPDKDQDTCTDPESRVIKHSSTQGFDQDYTGQIALDQQRLLSVGLSLSNQPTDPHQAEPTRDTIRPDLATPQAAALDTGYGSAATSALFERREIAPSIAPGRDLDHRSWCERFAALPAPAAHASPKLKMADKLKSAIGQAIERVGKCTVEPLIGSIKAVLGWRQFSRRGEQAAAGEGCLVGVAFALSRLHSLLAGEECQ